MKLLFLTTRLFGQPTSGGEICTARLLQALRREGHRLTLVGRGEASGPALEWAERVVSVGGLMPPFEAQAGRQQALSVASALFSGQPVTVQRQGGAAAARAIAPLLADPALDAIVVDHLQVWPWLRGATGRPCLLVHHNVESDNYMRRAREHNRRPGPKSARQRLEQHVMRREAQALRALELKTLQQARVVACLSQADATRMAELARQAGSPAPAHLTVLPGYPLRPLGPGLAAAPTPTRGLRRVGLIGTWTWAPNRQALQWFLAQVWPRLAGPCQLVIAGTGLQGLALPPGTEVLGRVADVAAFYAAVDLVAIPSVTGSGVQEKAIEAIGTGLPVVATAHALRGLDEGLPAQVRTASDAEGFAAACLAAVAQPAGVQGLQAAQAWVEQRRLGFERALAQALERLHQAPRPHEEGLLPLRERRA
jgi:polysaccharide biosynthesis protein PslH